jgi:hypothetical protein
MGLSPNERLHAIERINSEEDAGPERSREERRDVAFLRDNGVVGKTLAQRSLWLAIEVAEGLPFIAISRSLGRRSKPWLNAARSAASFPFVCAVQHCVLHALLVCC